MGVLNNDRDTIREGKEVVFKSLEINEIFEEIIHEANAHHVLNLDVLAWMAYSLDLVHLRREVYELVVVGIEGDSLGLTHLLR